MTGKDNDANAATSLPPKEAPESLELRAKPRPVTRLNPRMLAVVVGGLSAAVLGAMLWSLQPQQRRQGAEPNELYNVDRVARPRGWSSCRETTRSCRLPLHPGAAIGAAAARRSGRANPQGRTASARLWKWARCRRSRAPGPAQRS